MKLRKLIPYSIRKILHTIKKYIYEMIFYDQWSLLICDLNNNVLKEINPPNNYIWADPFPIDYEGKIYIFIEQQFKKCNGTIGYIELYPDLTHSGFIPVLEKEYHLSFPNVFSIKKNNQTIWYMIPESYQNKTIDLYRAVHFPDIWIFDQTLINNITAVDTTIFFYNKLWWLFTSIGVKDNNFCIFYSDLFPTDNWIPHQKNPLCTNSANSRMAGAVFNDKKTGLLSRPSQDCSKIYGKAIHINKIDELSPALYSETVIQTILPEHRYKAICTHTINFSNKYILRDIMKRKCKLFK